MQYFETDPLIEERIINAIMPIRRMLYLKTGYVECITSTA